MADYISLGMNITCNFFSPIGLEQKINKIVQFNVEAL